MLSAVFFSCERLFCGVYPASALSIFSGSTPKKMSDGDSCQSIGEVIFTDKPGLYFVIFAFVVRFPLEGEVRRIAGDVSVDVQPSSLP